MKRKLLLILCCIVLSTACMQVFAAERSEIGLLLAGDYQYTLDNEMRATITAWTGSNVLLEIPNLLDGHPVVAIGENAFKEKEHLEQIRIPEGLLQIGKSAFWNCSGLKEVELSSSLQILDEHAFTYCESLEIFNIPVSVISIGSNAFTACEKLSAIKVDEDNPVYADIAGVLFNKTERSLHTYPAGKDGSSYSVPKGILSIGEAAFVYNESLEEVIIPGSVSSIGRYAFYSCNKLKSARFDEGLRIIGEHAFSDSGIGHTIQIPASVTDIAEGAFSGCTSLKYIDVAETDPFRTYIHFDYVLVDNRQKMLHSYPSGRLEEFFIIPEGILAIGENAFFGCYNLKTIVVPQSVTAIGEYAFNNYQTVIVKRGSYAADYAQEHEIAYQFDDP